MEETLLKDKVKCDVPGCQKRAEYDSKTKFGGWAYLCDNCYRQLGLPLGLGTAQKIIYKEDIT